VKFLSLDYFFKKTNNPKTLFNFNHYYIKKWRKNIWWVSNGNISILSQIHLYSLILQDASLCQSTACKHCVTVSAFKPSPKQIMTLSVMPTSPFHGCCFFFLLIFASTITHTTITCTSSPISQIKLSFLQVYT